MTAAERLVQRAASGEVLDLSEARELGSGGIPLESLLEAASFVRDETTGPRITFSKKVFIPLTQLCRDTCGYCTFAHPPREGEPAFLSLDQVLDVARAGRDAGCAEALFTLGEKPERRWPEARAELLAMGFGSTLEYLLHACREVFRETGLFPHANPGSLSEQEAAALREVSVSQGAMVESLSERLLRRGEAHWGAPDKRPEARLATLEAAGRAGVPFTTGILIGIGETLEERIEALHAIAASHRRHGHIQEVIVQNFRAKPGTRMSAHPEPTTADMRLTLALARLILPRSIALQAPPNLTPQEYGSFLAAGICDWGGISPVTPDHVNPERPWPKLDEVARVTAEHGFVLQERLAVYPRFCDSAAAIERWVDPSFRTSLLQETDAEGFRRTDLWYSGGSSAPPAAAERAVEAALTGAWRVPGRRTRSAVTAHLSKVQRNERLEEDEVASLFTATGAEMEMLFAVADAVRKDTCGDEVTYVVNRNINYTNMCYFRCGFCAFSKGPKSLNLRGDPYLLSPEEVAQRALEAHRDGATEVCMQGGIHGSFTGDDYVSYLKAVKEAVPELHVHAFTALEVWQGAQTLGIEVGDFLRRLKAEGLATLPGTAAEILDDEIRAIICPDKITTAQWCRVHEEAHEAGLRSNATIMFGTVDGPRNWARHLIVVRDLHDRIVSDGGEGLFEFVPLPFVHMAAPIFLRGGARRGPTFEETLKMHAVARLALAGAIPNIQVSWVKMGVEGAKLALRCGANDLGGTLMNENISRAAGAAHGQGLSVDEIEGLIRSIGRIPRRRTTLYAAAR